MAAARHMRTTRRAHNARVHTHTPSPMPPSPPRYDPAEGLCVRAVLTAKGGSKGCPHPPCRSTKSSPTQRTAAWGTATLRLVPAPRSRASW
jgi:hypothetical protein